jgi:hypothetical protein
VSKCKIKHCVPHQHPSMQVGATTEEDCCICFSVALSQGTENMWAESLFIQTHTRAYYSSIVISPL